MAGIYIHIPFCKQACYYCDFHFSTNASKSNEMVEAMIAEIGLQHKYLQQEQVETIYFGGGTPSLLSEENINRLLAAIRSHFIVVEKAEITLEGNPDDLTYEKLVSLRASGINRLSIGIQSFDDQVLTFLHRAHKASTASNCLHDARRAGFENISIDLIHSIPGQSDKQWIDNLTQGLSFSPQHLSAYSLTIEEKTVFGKWKNANKIIPLDEEASIRQFDLLMDTMERSGYEHYEISNYARPGFESRHNRSYWEQKKYLGIGPSAHSFDIDSRQWNVSSNHLYLKALNSGKIPFEKEELSTAHKINEYIFTSMRTKWGCDLQYVNNQFSVDLLKSNAAYVDQLLKEGHITFNQGIINLTRSGKLLADQIAADFFITPESKDTKFD